MADEIPFIPPIPEGLRDAAQTGKLIPFVGAGASRLAGCPSWSELADRALASFVEQGKFTYGQLDQIRHLNPRVRLSIALGLQKEHGVSIKFDKIICPSGRYDNEIGRRLYGSLAKLGKTFVTTNYDAWLDEYIVDTRPTTAALGQQETAPETIVRRKVYDRVDQFIPANLSQPQAVFHLHGSLREPGEMILTTRNYVQRYASDRHADDPARENRTLTFLEHLFGEKTVLFVGYGLDELEILEYVIQKAKRVGSGKETEAKHFMLQGFYSHEYQLMLSLRNYYRNECGIQLLPFLRDQRDFRQLLEVLEKFADEVPAADPMHLQKLIEMEALLAE